jgi:hypothetical protein
LSRNMRDRRAVARYAGLTGPSLAKVTIRLKVAPHSSIPMILMRPSDLKLKIRMLRQASERELKSSNGDCGGGSVNSKLTATIHLVISATIRCERVAPEVIQAGRRSRGAAAGCLCRELRGLLTDRLQFDILWCGPRLAWGIACNSIQNGESSSRSSAARRSLGRSRPRPCEPREKYYESA